VLVRDHPNARGASLAGLLVMVIVLGALAAGAIVGVQAMTGSDSSTRAGIDLLTTTSTVADRGRAAVSNLAQNACLATADAARSASSLFFVNVQRYPTTWSEMTAPPSAAFTLAGDDVVNPSNRKELDGQGWRLIMAGGGATAPTFTCR
jgi:hypothetical protein